MDPILWFGVAVAVGVAVTLAIVQWARRSGTDADAAQHQVRERRARDLGWVYDPKRNGDHRYRFGGSSPGGTTWEMVFDSAQSSSSAAPKLIWTAATLRTDGARLFLGGRKKYEAMTHSVTKKLAAVAGAIFGRLSAAAGDYSAFVQESREVTTGSSRFRARFALAARDARLAGGVLDTELERLILEWPAGTPKGFVPEQALVVWQDGAGLRVECDVDAPQMSVCERVARIGEHLADRLAVDAVGPPTRV